LAGLRERIFWPAHYFIDAKGLIRHHHFGEGEYDESERVIQKLLADAGDSNVPTGIVAVNASGAEAASAKADVESPETYIGYNRIDHFVSPGGVVQDTNHVYAAGSPHLNDWSLVGNWTISGERALLNEKNGSIVYRYDLKSMSMDELWSLHEFVSSALARKIPAETARLNQRLRQLGLGAVSHNVEKTSHARRHPYPKVFPKYRNPAKPSETWAGRGKKPRWLTAQLKSGKRIDDFRIDLAAA
jgi:DNA-binding protein H-NS